MILHRALHLLLREAGLDEGSPPTPEEWPEFLRSLSLAMREDEEERARLERSVDIHGREIQALYEGLESERRRLGLLLASLRDALLLCDGQGVVQLVTPEAEWLTGRSERDWVGQSLELGEGERSWGSRRAHLTVELLDTGDYLVRLQPVGESAPPPERVEPTVEEEPAPLATVTVTGPPMRVLVLEESGSSMLLQRQVETLGHKAVVVTDVQQALQQLRKKPVDAVLASSKMGGLELCRKVRESAKGADLYYILLGNEDLAAAGEAGVDACLPRPVDAATLASRLRVAAGLQAKLKKR